MFGYVRVFQPDLKVKEYEMYRGVYCALCKQLGKRYGFLSRMTLSYDFTFLALLKSAVSSDECGFRQCRCPAHPFKKRNCCNPNASIAFAADAAVLTVYHKCRDSIRDDGFWKSVPSRVMLPFAKRAAKKASAAHPQLAAVLEREMNRQAALEQERCASIDQAAEPTAVMLSMMMAAGENDEKQRRVLERLGYCLGRWVYLIDAVDDLDDDLQSGGYNPYIYSRSLTTGDTQAVSDTKSYATLALNACLAECMAAYDLLSVKRFDGILRNILSCGMTAQQIKATKEKPI